MMKNFEFIEHTADVGIRVYGEDLESLFRNGAVALCELLVDKQPKGDKKKEVYLEAGDIEELFVNWLNELIGFFFAYNFLPAEYSICMEDKDNLKSLKVHIRGEDYNPYENKINNEIKAATYHNLKITRNDKGYMAEVIFDV